MKHIFSVVALIKCFAVVKSSCGLSNFFVGTKLFPVHVLIISYYSLSSCKINSPKNVFHLSLTSNLQGWVKECEWRTALSQKELHNILEMFTKKPINLRAPLDHVDESTIIVLAETFTIWIAPELHLVESLKSEIRSVSKFVVYHFKVSFSEWQRFLVRWYSSQDLRNN